MAQKQKLVWYSPKWSTHPKQWWILRKHVLSAGPLLRITGATIGVSLMIIAALKLAFPGLVLPNLWRAFLALPAIIAAMVFQFGVLSLFRQRIVVTPKKIVISHGQSALVIKMPSLKRATLTAHANGKSRIRFDYEIRSKRRSKTVGLSDDCKLFDLAELLPVEIETRDARRSPANST